MRGEEIGNFGWGGDRDRERGQEGGRKLMGCEIQVEESGWVGGRIRQGGGAQRACRT